MSCICMVIHYRLQLFSDAMAWQIAIQLVKRYFPQIMLPITITVGYIGYTIEGYLRPHRIMEHTKSVGEQREERRLEQMRQKSSEETVR